MVQFVNIKQQTLKNKLAYDKQASWTIQFAKLKVHSAERASIEMSKWKRKKENEAKVKRNQIESSALKVHYFQNALKFKWDSFNWRRGIGDSDATSFVKFFNGNVG